uniref:DUF4515 domain-containing protein n=1 Tax=Molossus molossus TaxID=27622 RepID=A0A7J8I5I4_MOLMO|nr:hypothetical protein HJG59_002204 [Molossus molossus]
MEVTFSICDEETKVPGDQSAGAVWPRKAVPLRPRAPARTTLQLRPEAPSRTAGPQRPGAPSSTLVPPGEAPSSTLVPPRRASSRSVIPLQAALSSDQVSWRPRGFRTVDTSAELRHHESEILATREDSSIPPTSYFLLIRNCLKPEKPTQAVMGLIEKTVEVMKLDHQIKETQIQQKVVLEETELLLNEKLPVQAETKVMLANLADKTRVYRREVETQWSIYAQGDDETLQPRQEFASNYAKQTSELPTTQPSEKAKLESEWEVVRGVSLVREKQYRELQTLQEELKKARAQTAAKAQARYLQEKALLEKQLSEPALSMLGKREVKELKRKAQALEVAAERRASELHRLRAQSQESHKELLQSTQQCSEEKTPQSWLKIQKQQLQQEWLCMECSLLERQGLQQGAPRTRGRSLLATESYPSSVVPELSQIQ